MHLEVWIEAVLLAPLKCQHEERDMQSTTVVGSVPASASESHAVKVLFVEDDIDYREALAGELSDHGFTVQCFDDGEAVLAALKPSLPADVILLDWSLPGTSGIDLVPELRQRGIELPIVFLTGHSLIRRETEAFNRGAIDFIDKLRGTDILVRRLQRAAKMVRPAVTNLSPEQPFICGNLVLRPSIGRAYWKGADVELTMTEYKIVCLLTSIIGHQVSYREIYDTMRYQGFVAGSGAEGYRINVRGAIKRLRKKFLKLDPAFDEIENYASVGYIWCA
jgi:two-component system response regulator ChvI